MRRTINLIRHIGGKLGLIPLDGPISLYDYSVTLMDLTHALKVV